MVEQRLMLSFQIITIMIMGMVITGEVTVTLTMMTTMGMRKISTAEEVLAVAVSAAAVQGDVEDEAAPHL